MWEITRDNYGRGQQGAVSRDLQKLHRKAEHGQARPPQLPYHFRLYDADGWIYFEGDSDTVGCPKPLEQFGRRHGCNKIRYRMPDHRYRDFQEELAAHAPAEPLWNRAWFQFFLIGGVVLGIMLWKMRLP